jgi:aspartate racemase
MQVEAPSNASPSNRPDPSLTDEQRELLEILLQEERAQSAPTTPGTSSVVPIKATGARTPLFCVGVFQFRALGRHLHPEQPLYGLLGIGLDEGGRYMQKVEELAAYYVRDIRRMQPEGPYNLMGFCFGGLVAYEIARQLESEGARVGLVAMLTAARPGCEPAIDDARTSKPGLMRRHVRALNERGGRYLLDWTVDRLRYERNRLRTAGERLLIRMYNRRGTRLPHWLAGAATYEADLERAAHYSPAGYGGTLTIIGHAGDPDENAETLAAGWRPLARDVITIDVPGDHHMGSLKEPSVGQLAGRLQELLDSVA